MNQRQQCALLGICILCWLIVPLSVRAGTDTIPDLTKQTQTGDWLRLPSGKVVWAEMYDSAGESDEAAIDDLGLESMVRRDNLSSCVTSKFAGVMRARAKTIPYRGWAKRFATLDKLVAWLPSDSSMAFHEPPIDRKADSRRVAEERRNVRVRRAWLLAAYREGDNDFHLVLCNRPKYDATALLFSVEISGLPDPSSLSRKSYRRLVTTRKRLISRLGDLRCGSTHIFQESGIAIRIKGSLFFDINHAGQVHGRKGLHPKSAWEIHPVTKIKWLD